VQTWPSLVATNGLGIVSRGDGTATGAWGNQPYFMIISAGPPLIVNCGLNAAGAAIGVVAAAPIPAGGWHHILMAYDKVNLKVYVDNVLRVTTAFSTSITSSAVLTYIGTWYSLVATRCFFGRIFDVRIWNSTLLQADCTGLYSSGLSGSNLVTPIQPGSLVGWWKLNDFTPGQTGAVPTTAADSSGNGFTGTLAGTDKPMWLAGSNLLF
jgi:hypothetical protein